MDIIRTIKSMQAEADRLRKAGTTIGFVPTMGYLHEGHLSLVQMAKQRSDVVVLSIFVNPTQFGPNEDFERYPRDFKKDENLAEQAGVNILFYPSTSEMYPHHYLTHVNVERITEGLCGASRPGHFRGVATICAKLFHAVKPHFAVFGQKDAQQVATIRQMVRDLNFDMEIVVAPTVREKDGLAMSSRNVYLSPEERQDALALHQSLELAEGLIRKGEKNSQTVVQAMRKIIENKKQTRIDYISVVNPDSLEPLPTVGEKALIALAVFVGKTRLIDNAVVE